MLPEKRRSLIKNLTISINLEKRKKYSKSGEKIKRLENKIKTLKSFP